jgi:hypothetical protein
MLFGFLVGMILLQMSLFFFSLFCLTSTYSSQFRWFRWSLARLSIQSTYLFSGSHVALFRGRSLRAGIHRHAHLCPTAMGIRFFYFFFLPSTGMLLMKHRPGVILKWIYSALGVRRPSLYLNGRKGFRSWRPFSRLMRGAKHVFLLEKGGGGERGPGKTDERVAWRMMT